MKMIRLQILVLFLLTGSLTCTELPKYFYKKMQGTVGNEKVTLSMIRIDTAITGSYYYEKYGKPIEFSYRSSIRDNKVFIEEDNFRAANYRWNITGYFNGEFVNENTFKGVWMKPDSSKKYDFVLTESYPAGSARFDIAHSEDSFGNCDTIGCASIFITYPVMKDFPLANVRDSVNNFILGNILFPKIEMDTTLKDGRFATAEDMMQDFMKRYKVELKDVLEYSKDYAFNWSGDYDMAININEDNLLGLTLYEYNYLGGAHGTFTILHYNLDLRTGKLIRLEDIFREGFKQKLNVIAEKLFRAQYDAPRRQSLEESGFWFKDNVFDLNDNFGLSKDGITFQFNQYEIAPYAAGSPEIFIPWNKIDDLLKEESIIRGFLN